jgi:hypothetical protein
MSTLQQLETAVQDLSLADLAQFRKWFTEYDGEVWDQQIEADALAGKLDQPAEVALREDVEGRTSDI